MDRFVTLAMASSIAVAIVADADVMDIELIPIRPFGLEPAAIERQAREWAPRGLRFIGAVGIVDGKPCTCLTEPLDEQRIFALSQAFVAYVETLLSGHIEARQKGDSVAWCERLYALPDPRPCPRLEA